MSANVNAKYLIHCIKVVFIRPKRALQVLKNLFYDLKYGHAYLGVPLENQNNKNGYINTTSTEYTVLKKLFSTIQLSDKDIIVDVGCGKGRVLAWLIKQKIKIK